jgi:hypothetical protein
VKDLSAVLPSTDDVADEDKVFLKVSFEDKDAVKALGSRFDMNRRIWYYVPSRTSALTRIKFAKWPESTGVLDKLNDV